MKLVLRWRFPSMELDAAWRALLEDADPDTDFALAWSDQAEGELIIITSLDFRNAENSGYLALD